jgi:hypothetical protein
MSDSGQRSAAADALKTQPRCDHGVRHPAVDGVLDPKWRWHGPNMAARADQIHYGPVPLPAL